MKIEQRALDIITDNVLLRKNTPKVRGAIRDALIQIATEQKAIDDKERVVRMLKQTVKHREETDDLIDKGCEWLVKNQFNYINPDGSAVPAFDVAVAYRKAMKD